MARKVGSEGAKTEAAIRQAALALIARHGFEAVSMRRLAEEVGVQASALYRYYPTKQDLLVSLLREHMRALIELWREARPRGATALTELEAFARFHVRHHMTRRDEVFVNYMELRSLEPANLVEITALRGAYEAELRAILARGRDSGAFRLHDPAVTAMALIAMLTGVTTWMRPGGRLTADQIEDIYTTLTLNAVGASPAERAETGEDALCSTTA